MVEEENRLAPPKIGAALAHGFAWSVAATAVTRIGIFLTGVMLAHYLAPADIGVFSIGLLVLQVVLFLSDLGIHDVLVRLDGTDLYPTAQTLAVGLGVGIFCALQLVARPVVGAMNAPAAESIVRIIAFVMLIDAPFLVTRACLTRDFGQKFFGALDVVGMVIFAVFAIGGAVIWHSPMGMAFGRLLGNLVAIGALSTSKYRSTTFGWNRDHARMLLRAGLPLALSGLLNLALMNIDFLVISRVLGPESLGLYVVAWNVSSWAFTLFSVAASRVAVTGFARLRSKPKELLQAGRTGLTLMVLVSFPVCLGISALARPIVDVIYPDNFLASSPALRFLAVVAFVRIITTLLMSMFVGIGKTRLTVVIQLVWLIILLFAFPIAVHADGIRGVALAHLIVGLAFVLPVCLLVSRKFGLIGSSSISDLGRALPGIAAFGVILALARTLSLGSFSRVAIAGGGSFVVYGLLEHRMVRGAYRDFSRI